MHNYTPLLSAKNDLHFLNKAKGSKSLSSENIISIF